MILNPYLFVLSYDMDEVVAQKSNRKDLVLLEAIFFKKKPQKQEASRFVRQLSPIEIC